MQRDPTYDVNDTDPGHAPLLSDEMVKLLRERSSGSKAYLIGTILGISIGALFCIAGFVIAILGLTGSIEWVFEAGGLKSRLSNASPGAFFALLGMIVIWRYKPKIEDRLDLSPDRSIRHGVYQFGPTFRIKHDHTQ